MKYNQTKMFSNVTAFDPKYDLVTCRKNNENLLIASNRKFVLDELPIRVRENDQSIYILFSNGKCIVFDKHGNLINNIRYYVNLKIFNCDFLYVYNYDNDYNITYNLFDIKSNKLVSETFFICELYCYNGIIIGFNNFNDDIKRFTCNNEILWQYPLSSLGNVTHNNQPDEIDNILGIAHGNLWFYTKAGRLVALDVVSGREIVKFSPLQPDEALGYKNCDTLGWIYFNENDKNIYSLSSLTYQKVDTKSLIVEEKLNIRDGDYEPLKKYSIRNALLQGDYFTFIACNQGGGKYRFLGIFDYKKKELVWEYELFAADEDNELIAPEPLYMSGNKLYIKDFKNNLHIFEREV